MKSRKPAWALLALAAVTVQPGAAQVEKVAMRTTGISCGICAGLSEIYFRRLPGVDQVKISLSKEAILLTYKPGAAFDPEGIRKILQPLEVGVTQFQISAHGQHRGARRQTIPAGGQRQVRSAVRHRFAGRSPGHSRIR